MGTVDDLNLKIQQYDILIERIELSSNTQSPEESIAHINEILMNMQKNIAAQVYACLSTIGQKESRDIVENYQQRIETLL